MSAVADTIFSRITDGSLLPVGYYSALDRDAALDARDSDRSLTAAWAAVHERIEEAWASSPPDERRRDLVERIRREAFFTVSEATSQHEIASYVSDDLDLVARGEALGLSDPLLEYTRRGDSRYPRSRTGHSADLSPTEEGCLSGCPLYKRSPCKDGLSDGLRVVFRVKPGYYRM